MSSNHIYLRSATLSDAERIAALVAQLGYQTTADDMNLRLERLLAHPEHVLVVAEVSGDIVGLVAAQIGQGLEINDPYARITGLVVDSRCRRHGVGRILMEHMESWCRGRGVHSVILTSGNHRVDAHKFYQRIGYTATGQRFIKRL
jgi:GNAT superfamily N-acetyltransferase